MGVKVTTLSSMKILVAATQKKTWAVLRKVEECREARREVRRGGGIGFVGGEKMRWIYLRMGLGKVQLELGPLQHKNTLLVRHIADFL